VGSIRVGGGVGGVHMAVRRPKYRNRKTVVDGLVFDSAKEARVYQELRVRERLREIEQLTCQVTFPLHGRDGTKTCHYRADFTYVVKATGEFVTVDVKGYKTPMYTLKSKLFRSEYGWSITEV